MNIKEDMSTGCVIVNYNTPEIISRAADSIKNLVDHIIIVDHSDTDNESYKECDLLKINNENIKVIHTHKNIGHGPGLHMGIVALNDRFIIPMDSDAIVRDKSIINEMRDTLLLNDIYGCGYVVKVDQFGNTVSSEKNSINYLHPYFCMFEKSTYLKYEPFINHGAPFIKTMKQIKNKIKIMNIKNITTKCFHEHRRTRDVIGQGKWGKNWVQP